MFKSNGGKRLFKSIGNWEKLKGKVDRREKTEKEKLCS